MSLKLNAIEYLTALYILVGKNKKKLSVKGYVFNII